MNAYPASLRRRWAGIVAGVLAATTVSAEPVPTDDMYWPRRLWEYFGVVGLLSVAAWVLAVVVAVRFGRARRTRLAGFAVAFLVASAGYGLAQWNSNRVAQLTVDDAYESKLNEKRVAEEARKQALEQAKEDMQNPTAGYQRRFAEDAPADWLDAAGKKNEGQQVEEMSKYERIASGYDEAAQKELGIKDKIDKQDQKPRLADVGDAPVAGNAPSPGEGQPAGASAAGDKKDEASAAGDKKDEAGAAGDKKDEASAAGGKKDEAGAAGDKKDEASAAGVDPAYRQNGPKTRTAGAKDAKLDVLADTSKEQKAGGGVRYLLKATLEAGGWAGTNRQTAEIVFLALFGLLVFTYVRYFNRTVDFQFPLPVGGPWLDLMSRKQHSVLLSRQGRAAVAVYLHRLVRKGETFLYFGPENPLAQPYLVRVALGLGGAVDRALERAARWLYGPLVLQPLSGEEPEPLSAMPGRWLREGEFLLMIGRRALRRFLGRLPVFLFLVALVLIPLPIFVNIYDLQTMFWFGLGLVVLFGLLLAAEAPWLDGFFVRNIHFDWQTQPKSTDYVFDSVWFGRASFTVSDAGLAQMLLVGLNRFLQLRSRTDARASRTVNIVWDFEDPPADHLLLELSALCRRTNFRLLLITPNARTMYSSENIFDERFLAPLPMAPDVGAVIAAGFSELQRAGWQKAVELAWQKAVELGRRQAAKFGRRPAAAPKPEAK